MHLVDRSTHHRGVGTSTLVCPNPKKGIKEDMLKGTVLQTVDICRYGGADENDIEVLNFLQAWGY